MDKLEKKEINCKLYRNVAENRDIIIFKIIFVSLVAIQ